MSGFVAAELVVSDPFIERRGLRAGAEALVLPALTVDLSAGAYPNLGQGDHTALTRSLLEDLEVTPTVSRTVWRAELGLRVVPLRVPVAEGESAIGVAAGAGLARTVDDTLGNPPDPDFARTERQTLATWRLGLDAQWRRGVWGVRASVARLARREDAGSAAEAARGDLWVGGLLLWTPRRRDRPSAAEEPLEPSRPE